MGTPEAQLSTVDKVVLTLDSQDMVHNLKFVTPFGLIIGFGVGVGTYNLVKEVGFPANDQYEDAEANIKAAQQSIKRIEGIEASLSESGVNAEIPGVNEAIAEYETTIAVNEAAKPVEYNPTFEGFVSGGSAILLGSVAAYGVIHGVANWAANIRNRHSLGL